MNSTVAFSLELSVLFLFFSSPTRLLPQYVNCSRFHLVAIANSSTYSLTISRPPPLTTHAAMGKFLAIAVSLLAALTAVTSAPVPYSESEVERMRFQGRSEVCAMLPYIDRTIPSPSPPEWQQRFLFPPASLLPTYYHSTRPTKLTPPLPPTARNPARPRPAAPHPLAPLPRRCEARPVRRHRAGRGRGAAAGPYRGAARLDPELAAGASAGDEGSAGGGAGGGRGSGAEA